MRNGVIGAVCNHRLGPIGDAEAGNAQHRNIVRTITHGDGLRQGQPFAGHQLTQQRRLALTVNHLANHTACELAVPRFEPVGVHHIDAQPSAQSLTNVLKSAGKNRCAITVTPEGTHQALGAFRQLNRVCDPVQQFNAGASEQRHPTTKALLKIQLAAHRRRCNRRHLRANAVSGGKFVDHLALNERRVHIKGDQTPIAAIHIVSLHRDVHGIGTRNRHQAPAQRLLITECAAQSHLNDGVAVLAFNQCFGTLICIQRSASGQLGHVVNL